ncbi:hypothetical protein Q4R49_00600, partial [Morganella morganii subsp. sibonii]
GRGREFESRFPLQFFLFFYYLPLKYHYPEVYLCCFLLPVTPGKLLCSANKHQSQSSAAQNGPDWIFADNLIG